MSMFVHKHPVHEETDSCSLLLLIGVAGSCTLGIEDNSLLHAKWPSPSLVGLAVLLLLFS